jgi:DNA recombination-dependent growth factor C
MQTHFGNEKTVNSGVHDMSFESGSLSVRMFYLPQPLPETVHDLFAGDVLGSIDHLLDEELNGWVGARHLLDREIHEGSAWPSGFLRLTLCQAQRKIPASLLRAECRIEEMVWMQAENRDYVNRQTRSEIKQQVIERLLPQMPPTLRGIDFCYDKKAGVLYATALSEKQLDAFMIHFTKTTGAKLIPVDPVSAAWNRAQCRADQWPRWGFAAEQWADCAPGREFLMWLWFMSEAKGGQVDLPDGGRFAVLVEGPLLFDQEEQGETIVRKGEPMVSAETRAALLSGKKLRRAKLTLARSDEEQWIFTLDADEFIIRSLKLPKTEAIDAEGRFQERMEMLDVFRLAFLGLYETFVKLRDDTSACKTLTGEMKAWMAARPARKLVDGI